MNGNLYNIGPLGEIVMETWLDGPSPQCLVVKLPTMRRVGEDEFLLDLAKERYRRRGFRDAFGRHFISRRFALEGTSWDAEAFLGQAREVAEITDDFYCLDAIDMSEWMARPMSGERWHALIRHIQTSPHTDFVLLARTGSIDRVESLSRAVSNAGFLLPEFVEVYPPSPAMLANKMIEDSPLSISEAYDVAVSLFENMRVSGLVPNYTLAHDLAWRAANSLCEGLDPESAVLAAFGSRGITFENRRLTDMDSKPLAWYLKHA